MQLGASSDQLCRRPASCQGAPTRCYIASSGCWPSVSLGLPLCAGPSSEELPYTEEFFLPGSGASRGLTSQDLEASRTQTWDDATATVSIDDVDKPGPHTFVLGFAASQQADPLFAASPQEGLSSTAGPWLRRLQSGHWQGEQLWRHAMCAAPQGRRLRSCHTLKSSSCPAAAQPAA